MCMILNMELEAFLLMSKFIRLVSIKHCLDFLMKQLVLILFYSFKRFNYLKILHLMQIDAPVRFVVISLFPHFSLRKREQLAKDNMLYCQLGTLSVKSQIDLVCFDS